MRRFVAFLSLFTSIGTLFCCALPALFVLLGFGAAFAGLIGNVPQLVWFSEYKIALFSAGAVFLTVGGGLQWESYRKAKCPTDPILAEHCTTTRDWSRILYFTSLGIYLVGFFFAFGADRF